MSTTVPAIDWSRLDELQRMEAEGMPGLAARLVRTYLENSARLMHELQAAMAAGDADGVRRAAHSIKSTAANIGATPLSQFGRTLEHAAQTAEWIPAQADVDCIWAEYRQVIAALGERFVLGKEPAAHSASSGKLAAMKNTHTASLFQPAESMMPLAERMRPRRLDDFVGQARLLAAGTPLRRAIEAGRVHSMILWGPPGCGKTSLARVLAHYADAHYASLSAVLTNLAEVRGILAEAAARFAEGRHTVLFVDEVHRFNKAQQDAFLPHIERGSILFVGATTENPSFELNSALLSRCRVHVMDAVSPEAIVQALRRALDDADQGLGALALTIYDAALFDIARAADGDVRRALTLLEIAAELGVDGRIDEAVLEQVLADRVRRFDKGGDAFYDQISALHKSVRNSNPDAALYWIARMFDGGCDAAYLARRLVRMAIEDIGLADPSALERAIAAWEAFDRLGNPEGELALAGIAVYLAMAPKSNASYMAFKAAQHDVREHGSLPVPPALRNAPTRLMKSLGHGRGYQYDPDVGGGIAYDQQCFPESLGEREYYAPFDAGIETRIRQRLDEIRAGRKAAQPERKS